MFILLQVPIIMFSKTSLITFLLQIAFLLIFLSPSQAFAQTAEETYTKGVVLRIISQTQTNTGDTPTYLQTVLVQEKNSGREYTIDLGSEFQPLKEKQLLKPGTNVVLLTTKIEESEKTVIAEIDRTRTMYWLFGIFSILVIIVSKWKGILSLIGMFASLGILSLYIVPNILAGENPLVISLIGSSIVGALTIYLSHGWSLKSHLALASIMSTLLCVALLSYVSVHSAKLAGLGSEEAYFLQFGQTSNINLQGLLLGGIMLGALGVLDDVTVSQISVVYELKRLKKNIHAKELYQRSLEVGKDHVASLVNTLVLAYAGTNLPLFILFTTNDQIPHWVTFNSEVILEEIVRTLTGSIGLVLAVPLSTLLTVFVLTKWQVVLKDDRGHGH